MTDSDARTERNAGDEGGTRSYGSVATDAEPDSDAASQPASSEQSPDPEWPGPSGEEPPTDPTPDPDTVRNWTAIGLILALTSFGSAAYTAADSLEATAGATILGLTLLAGVFAGRTVYPQLFVHLSSAWGEHRPYVGFAAGTFGFGIAIGALLVFAGVDLVEFFLEMLEEAAGEDLTGDPEAGDQAAIGETASFFIQNNTPPYLLAIAGAISLGLFTGVIMLFNGVLVGNIAFVIGQETGFALIVALLVPHGVFELTALFIAAGVGFRLVHRGVQRIIGTREAFITKPYLVRTGLFVLFGWLMLVVAAFVEAYLTVPIAETLFGSL